jgi:rhodanese-related sulfurtransferase
VSKIQNLMPEEVAERVKKGAVLIDVREPAEFEAERIAGAQLVPLSTLDLNALPKDAPLIFLCGIGKRSALALARTQQAGLPHDAHLAGGLQAWKAAGLPTIVGK